jgi:hypothetical protein
MMKQFLVTVYLSDGSQEQREIMAEDESSAHRWGDTEAKAIAEAKGKSVTNVSVTWVAQAL